MTRSSPESLDPLLVTAKQAGAMLALAPGSIYRLLDSGEIPSVYQGRKRYVRPADLRAYIEGLPTNPRVG